MNKNARCEDLFRGPAENLLTYLGDPQVSDILLNGDLSLYVEKQGVLSPCPNPFTQDEALNKFLERVLIFSGKQLDARSPYIDGSLPDGSRFHLVMPPISGSGPLLSIRKPSAPNRLMLEDFCTKTQAGWLREQVALRKNLLIAGGTGAGKTTLMSKLLDEIPPEERVILLEESRELQSKHPHLVRLEARPPGIEGCAQVSLSTLVRQTLRMRPDRIVLGEVRGEEAFDLMLSLNVGHRGSLCTLHANSAREALTRLETLLALSPQGRSLSTDVLREWVSRLIDSVVYLGRRGSTRKVLEIIQIHGSEGTIIRTSPGPP